MPFAPSSVLVPLSLQPNMLATKVSHLQVQRVRMHTPSQRQGSRGDKGSLEDEQWTILIKGATFSQS